MLVHVRLHSILQHTLPGRLSAVDLSLPDGSSVRSVLDQLAIALEPSVMVMVVNRKVVDEHQRLADGDTLDFFPAISGG
jgi:molybdopterin converting factor small subunit